METAHFRRDSGRLETKLKIAFTRYSRVVGMIVRNRKGHPRGTGTKIMQFWSRCARYALAIREFVMPTYRPERHYMRGPGPACARRGGLFGQASFQ